MSIKNGICLTLSRGIIMSVMYLTFNMRRCYVAAMQAQLEEIINHFHADTGSIHLLEDGILILKAHVGLPPHIADIVARVPIGKGMAGLAFERNEPVSSCN
ncbi:MAG TPA: hypothetical protein VFM05_02995, partial [Candidatus Saccharimonadales bacterium]|nr:hypothetical protein [Candidatus Saccharimonadales bacterium]